MENLEHWNKLKQPPPSALKTIQAGRLRGKSDINPQWRYRAMTETFGPCGDGWKYEVVKLWTENAPAEEILAFAEIKLYVRYGEKWSDSIPGIGGSMLVAKEKNGLYASDEAYKMAVTDALSVAMKMLGVAADVYAGLWDGNKYKVEPGGSGATTTKPSAPTEDQQKAAVAGEIWKHCSGQGMSKDDMLGYMSDHLGRPITGSHDLTLADAQSFLDFVAKKETTT